MAAPLHRAMHQNHLVAWERVAAVGPRSTMERVGPWLLLDTAVPEFAVASGGKVVDSARVQDLPRAIEWFERRGVSAGFLLREAEDAHLAAALEQRGFAPGRIEPALALHSPAPPAYDGPLTITEVVNDADIERYGPINWAPDVAHVGLAIARTARRLGFPLLMGTLDGRTVACSMAVVTATLVGVYNVAVDRPYRRRGFGEAISWAAITAGLSRGADIAWLGSTPMGHPLYERMGFREQYRYRDWDSPESASG